MLQRTKIITRLLAGFLFMVTAMAALGWIGVQTVTRLSNTVRDIFEHPFTVSTSILTVRNEILQNQVRGMKLVSTKDPAEAERLLKEIALGKANADRSLVMAHYGYLGDPQDIDDLENAVAEWRAMREETFILLRNGKRNEAIVKANTIDLAAADKALKEAADITEFAAKKAKEFKESAGRTAVRMVVIMYLSIFLILMLSLVMAIIIARSVTASLKFAAATVTQLVENCVEKAQIAEAIGGGDFERSLIITEPVKLDETAIPRDDLGAMLRLIARLSEAQARLDSALAGMTVSLRLNRAEEKQRYWLKSGANELNRLLRGDRKVEEMIDRSLAYLCEYLGAGVGAFYLFDDTSGDLELTAAYALSGGTGSKRISLGEGVAGEAAKEQKVICLTDVPPDYLPISSALGEAKPLNIAAIPLVHNDRLIGVLEIGSFKEFTGRDLEFMQQAREGVAIGISVNLSRKLVDDLLEQTQAQTEELRMQQEELQQSNEELEERAQMLEQQREQIRAKNREVEEASREIQAKANELERISTYKSEFLANMSHELRTPLNSLMILSSLLRDNRDGNLTPKQVEYAATINSAGTDLLNLINDILDLSKIESGRLDFNYESVSLQELWEQIRTMFTPVAEQRGLEFTQAIDADVPDEIRTDSQRMQQILKNLISNACKFTRQGRVSLRARMAEGGENPLGVPAIACEVSDTGIGLHPSKHELVFQAFQQADGTTSRKFGGTGLGLSISRQLARGLQGDICLQSEEGAGCTFTLYLPVDPSVVNRSHQESAPPGTPVPQRVTAAPGEPDSQFPEAPLPDDRDTLQRGGRSILIIEDDLSFAGILMDMVRKKGFRAIVAADGESGILLADRFLPSAIILDIMLPHIDGWGVMRSLKDNMKTRHIPVHFLTCLEDRQKAMSMGAVGFVTKPVDSAQLDQIFETIGQSLSRTMRKLLIVEDNRDEASSMVALLGERDVDITVAGTGLEAIDLLSREFYDCVVLDLGLSDISGFEVLERMQALEAHMRPPVIIHSGRELTLADENRLRHYAESIIIKGAKSPERLLNEVTLFLHVVESGIHPEKQRMIRQSLDSEVMLEGKKVLIVDDDMRNIFSLSSILGEKNMQVVEAENGRESLEKLNQHPDIDVVLMDIMMPEMDGYSAIRAIRKDPRFTKLPIIALTAKAMKGDRDECLKAGASDYIPKPVDVDKLFSLLRVWLYGNQ